MAATSPGPVLVICWLVVLEVAEGLEELLGEAVCGAPLPGRETPVFLSEELDGTF
jgi:hypothetical protein